MTTVKLKLTDSVLKTIPIEVTKVTDTILAGFHLRLGKPKEDGTRSANYYLYYRIGGRGGKASNYKLGSAYVLTATKARKLAEEKRGELIKGVDPQAQRRAEKLAVQNSKLDPTVLDLLNEFYTHYVIPHRKRPEEVKRSFKKDVEPTLGKYKLKDLNKRLVINKALDPIIARGKDGKGKVQANKTLSLLKQVFQFGVERGLLDDNPIADIKRQSVGGKENPRERYLTMDEIKTLINNLTKPDISKQIQHVIHILLLTGCRVGEVTLSQWKHIDFEKCMWSFPPENVKGRKGDTKGHVVPLNDEIIAVLESQQESTKDIESDYVFPCLTGVDKGLKPMDKRSVARAINRHHKQLGLEKFTPHDLRRTVQTQLAAMGIDGVVIEKILNHQLQGMMKVYNQYDYMKERDEALVFWSNQLSTLVEESNVHYLERS
jgi:integrase